MSSFWWAGAKWVTRDCSQNLLESFDVEYDLATGAIRLFKTEAAIMRAWRIG